MIGFLFVHPARASASVSEVSFDLPPPSDLLAILLGDKQPHLFLSERNQSVFLISQNVSLLISLQLSCGAAFRTSGPFCPVELCSGLPLLSPGSNPDVGTSCCVVLSTQLNLSGRQFLSEKTAGEGLANCEGL